LAVDKLQLTRNLGSISISRIGCMYKRKVIGQINKAV
jgi:hypothetical protein